MFSLCEETALPLCNDNRVLQMPREVGLDIGNRCVQDSPEGFSRIESHVGSQDHIGTAL